MQLGVKGGTMLFTKLMQFVMYVTNVTVDTLLVPTVSLPCPLRLQCAHREQLPVASQEGNGGGGLFVTNTRYG